MALFYTVDLLNRAQMEKGMPSVLGFYGWAPSDSMFQKAGKCDMDKIDRLHNSFGRISSRFLQENDKRIWQNHAQKFYPRDGWTLWTWFSPTGQRR